MRLKARNASQANVCLPKGKPDMRPIFLSLSLCLFATALEAGPDRFSILLGSKHIGGTGFNEVNPGFFATWERERSVVSVGAFMNSYERGSIAATSYRPLKLWSEGDFGIVGGWALYPEIGRNFSTHLGEDVVVIGGLQARYRNTFVQLIPMNAESADGLISFGFTFSAP